MAIKIIKKGNLKELFEGWCTYCGCEFEYEIEDKNSTFYDQREGLTYDSITCPCCGKGIRLIRTRKR